MMSSAAVEHRVLVVVVVVVEIDAAPDKGRRSIFDEEAVAFVSVFFLGEEPQSDAYARSGSDGDDREPREPPEP